MLFRLIKIIVYILGAYAIGTYGQRSPGEIINNEYTCSTINIIMIAMMLTVYLSIGRNDSVNITNDGYVRANDIGDFYHGPFLLCRTDNISCCSRSEVPNRLVLGNWFFPSGESVGSFDGSGGANGTFFGRNRGPSSVNLFRNGAPSERGRFRCSIPDAVGVNVDVYANIRKYNNDQH